VNDLVVIMKTHCDKRIVFSHSECTNESLQFSQTSSTVFSVDQNNVHAC
jgi:hypothetical protein